MFHTPKMRKIYLALLFLLFPIFAYLPSGVAFAEEDLAVMCSKISESEDYCKSLGNECRPALEKCADYYDQQSAEIEKDITKTKQQKNTLQNAVAALKKNITGLEAKIKQGKVMVQDLGLQINDTQDSIDHTTVKIESSREQIKTILREMYEQDQKPSFVILLEGNLSDFFNNITYLESLNSKVSNLLESTTNLKTYLEKQLDKMDVEKGRLQKTLQVQSLQKKENESNKKQQDALLKLTEAQYQQQQKDKAAADKNAAAIKARIFDLIGVSKAPTFGEALEIAKYVSSITGVRPALLLAILTQESSLGRNVGQCYVTNFDNGNGTNLQGVPKIRVMNPKSIPGFVTLTENLGMNSQKTPVSCWIPLYSKGERYGWGGAMGPAQFIATTWAIYDNKVESIVGGVANPWNIQHAFLASGLLLKDNGALSNESVAAAKYYCGGNYTRRECKVYANSVTGYAKQYEADIKAIGG